MQGRRVGKRVCRLRRGAAALRVSSLPRGELAGYLEVVVQIQGLHSAVCRSVLPYGVLELNVITKVDSNSI